MRKRTNLKCFRIKRHLTQQEIAALLGYSRGTYIAIENGARQGHEHFWETLQTVFSLADSEMGILRKRDEKDE